MKVLRGPSGGNVNLVESDRFRVSSQGFYLCCGKVSVHTFAQGMKESHAGRSWVAKEYDPEYTPKRDISPKKAVLKKFPHISGRTGGVLTDECLAPTG